jgi:hypothetical protein
MAQGLKNRARDMGYPEEEPSSRVRPPPMPLPLFAENEPLDECQTKKEQGAYASGPHRSADHEDSFGHQCSSQSFSSMLRRRSPPAAPICRPKMNESRAVVCRGHATVCCPRGKPEG